jgi:hypothetical protein
VPRTVEELLTRGRRVEEDSVPANQVGDQKIAGADGGDPPVRRTRKSLVLARRRPPP